MTHPCLTCGACCASFRVDFAVQELEGCGGRVPCGLADNGLPVGLHVVGARFADDQVLRVCRAYEKHFAQSHPHAPITP